MNARTVITVVSANAAVMVDPLSGGLPAIPDDAALEIVANMNAAAATVLHGALTLVQG